MNERSIGTRARMKRIFTALATVLLAVTMLIPTPRASNCPDFLGSLPYGPCEAVVGAPGIAYFGSGTMLVVLDTSDPMVPSVLSHFEMGGIIRDLFLDGTRLYAASGNLGLQIVDVSDPAAPVLLGTWTEDLPVIGVASIGNTAYACVDGEDHLYVVDASDPAGPVTRGSVQVWGIYDVAAHGQHAYLACYTNGLHVVDVSDPDNPVEVGENEVWGLALDVAVVATRSGTVCYVANYRSGLNVFDVNDPANPVELATQDVGDLEGISVEGNTAYCASYWPGFTTVDISDPSAPVQLDTYDTLGEGLATAVSGNQAYVAGSGGVNVLDVSDPGNLSGYATFPTSQETWGVDIDGNYAYAASTGSGLRILDISDPGHPTQVGAIATYYDATDVVVSGDYAFVAEHYNDLRVIDVSDPMNPDALWHGWTNGETEAIYLQGDRIYTADQNAVHIYDVTNPGEPVMLGTYDTPGYATDVAVQGNMAAVADWHEGWLLLDVSDPAAPSEWSAMATGDYCHSVALMGDHAYVGIQGQGIEIYDVSSPGSPVKVADVETDGAMDMEFEGNLLYVAGGDGLSVFDAADPVALIEVGSDRIESLSLEGSYDTPGEAHRVALSGGLAVLADGVAGVAVFNVSACLGVPGDCDGSGDISIGEVQRAINMFLGMEPVSCGVDCDANGSVSIGEVQKVINGFLGMEVSC